MHFPKICYNYFIMKKSIIFLVILFLSATFCFADEPPPIMEEQPSQVIDTSMKAAGSKWPRAAFLLHAGLIDIGLGAKIRFSHANGIYMTIDLRYQIFQFQYIRIPVLVYFGGNHVHFITGHTILNAVNAPIDYVSVELAVGLNIDFGKHWGIDILWFNPTTQEAYDYVGPSLLLDVRFVF